MDRERKDMRGAHPDLLRLDAVRAGEGTPEERAHAEGCPECREILDRFRAVEAELKGAALLVPEVPPEVDRAILSAYRDAFGKRGTVTPLRRRFGLPAAAVAAAAGVALFLLLAPREPAPPRVASLPAEPPGGSAPTVASAPPAAPSSRPGAGEGAVASLAAPGRGTRPAAPVDILSAYRMALDVERRRGVRLAWNRGDGATEEERAVDALARKAVTL